MKYGTQCPTVYAFRRLVADVRKLLSLGYHNRKFGLEKNAIPISPELSTFDNWCAEFPATIISFN